MRIYDLLHKKRMGMPLSDDEISYFVTEYTRGSIPDYQASALLMAIVCRGMDERETLTLTRAMMLSGDTIDLSRFGDRAVDKHSTGGVGDKTTLVLAPIVASLGAVVAKM
jgi:pyrimidine-nucleoside phosphorylase